MIPYPIINIYRALEFDKLCNELASKIESLIPRRKPELAYLFAEFTNTPGIELKCIAGYFHLIHKASGMDMFEDSVYLLLGNRVSEYSTMKRFAYWISLLDVEANVIVENRIMLQKLPFIYRLRDIINGTVSENYSLIHKGIKGENYVL